jgi:predicted dehydrogenase
MSDQAPSFPGSPPTRRDFLKNSAVGVASAAVVAANAHASGSDLLRVGLIGCGGRGTGAAEQALRADKNVRLTAMGDMFRDRLDSSLTSLRRDEELARKIDIKPDHCFTGFDAYKDVIGSGVDVVLLATPPHFRPLHLEAAVAAGKHIFCEKPVAVDAPGVRRVFAACEEARRKNVSLVSGLCWRYHHGMRETIRRVHDGMVGDIVSLQCTYNTHGLWVRDRRSEWSDMEWQLRNWLYYTWLSGDHNVEQHIHSLDKMAWALRDQYPVKAVGLGGRQVRTDPRFGQIFDHHSVVYEYANGIRLFSNCRQQDGTASDVSDQLVGTKGLCHIDAGAGRGTIRLHAAPGKDGGEVNARQDSRPGRGRVLWQSRGGDVGNMYQNEHDELFASIRSGKPIHNGDYMTKSTLMAIMGRMATYTGQVITWEMAMTSKEDLTPPHYEFGPLPVPPVAKPGVTKFI